MIIGGLATNSMAILADCIHDMSDTFSMAIAWILEHVAQKGATDKFSYGYQRFSILGAVITSTFVIVMAFFILSEAIPRLFSPEGVDAEGMLIIGIIGLLFKTISVWRLHGGETFNEKAIFSKTLRCGNDELKNFLTGCTKYITQRNEFERQESVYRQGVAAMESACTEQEYKEACIIFSTIKQHKNAKELLEMCKTKAEECKVKAEEARKD